MVGIHVLSFVLGAALGVGVTILAATIFMLVSA